MSITYERYINSQSNYTLQEFDLCFDAVIYLFGDYLTYNQLNKYKNIDLINLKVAHKLYDNNLLVLTIWFDDDFIDDIKIKNCGSELIYKLEQLDDDE